MISNPCSKTQLTYVAIDDGGDYMKMWFWHKGENPATAKPYYECDSSATYKGTSIVSMESCKTQEVKKGDQVIMESKYSKEKAG